MTIHNEHGRLTPPLVVDTARDPAHPLHSSFEWDDEIAGESYRLVQARELIRSITITYTKKVGRHDVVRTIRTFMSLPDPETTRSYHPLEQIVGDPITTEILIAEAKRDLQYFKKRYEHLIDFIDLVRTELGLEEAS
jgi:hypothetical protein